MRYPSRVRSLSVRISFFSSMQEASVAESEQTAFEWTYGDVFPIPLSNVFLQRRAASPG